MVNVLILEEGTENVIAKYETPSKPYIIGDIITLKHARKEMNENIKYTFELELRVTKCLNSLIKVNVEVEKGVFKQQIVTKYTYYCVKN